MVNNKNIITNDTPLGVIQIKGYALRNTKLKNKGYTSYNEFLNSKRWKTVREFAWKNLIKKECFICNKNPTQLHHLKYSRITSNTLRWIIPICDNCHDEIHREKKESVFTYSKLLAIRNGKNKNCMSRNNLNSLWSSMNLPWSPIKTNKYKKTKSKKNNKVSTRKIYNSKKVCEMSDAQLLKKLGSIAFYQRKKDLN